MSIKMNENELYDNPTIRIPICLVLDTSNSMNFSETGKEIPIDELNKGVKAFFENIKNDEIARYSAEISVVTFGKDGVQKVLDFKSIEKQNIPNLNADGLTPMSEGVTLALDLLNERKEKYSNVGIDYYQPWLVLMTDGMPTDNIEEISKKVSEQIEDKKLTIFPIGIGSDADLTILKKFSPTKPALRLRNLNFNDFFEWLSQSVSDLSRSVPGEFEFDVNKIKGWARI